MIKKYLIYQPVKVESLACNLFCVLLDSKSEH